MKISVLLSVVMLSAALGVAAQEQAEQTEAEQGGATEATEEFEAAPEPPDIPDPLQSGQPIDEPQVTIIQREDAVIEEYRISGRLYMVKVTPNIGPPYYLVDRDGDGRMESRLGRIDEDFTVPQWVIFSW